MVEEEWLAATDPIRMLEFLRGKVSGRKMRLLACGCCRRIEHLLSDQLTRSTIELAERYTDGMADDAEWNDAYFGLIDHRDSVSGPEYTQATAALCTIVSFSRPDFHRLIFQGLIAARRVMAPAAVNYITGDLENTDDIQKRFNDEGTRQSELLRDVFGNPFRYTTLDNTWLTSTVLALANGIYNDRAFDRLPILADALMDAGCSDEGILSHCRSEGAHCRGCWVVDLVLGKE
ncbi:Uncharacterized protein OS=Sorangium cellulosum (strain So ce56) GN=sce5710 PE=4 SV=1 [Gemmata massiliana]|uniref:SMI1/KNR4 family protein n=1 Tax=Gemmata massiliana TaxID=1210884 RepID=A0A6P2CWQ3_9BACT|nr:hypothetical protein [Gemmata massiliana]VTR92144.1 Uncharacterized protein OS=Sorangium cellulosum (strain So ce56) GN=sce5710 PE=4 SV=1 [Gemmata massiliana]